MSELLGVVILIIYIVAAGAAEKNKKKKKKARQNAVGSRNVQFEQAFERPAEAERPKAVEPAKKPSEFLPRINTLQEELCAAGEGEDPCHPAAAQAEGILAEDSPVYRSPIFHTEDQEAFAQDILRGVVMSEVLTRSVNRRANGGMKKRGA